MKCLHCDRPTYARGTCDPHYKRIRKDIAAGKITERGAVRTGRLLKKQKNSGPKPGMLAKRGK